MVASERRVPPGVGILCKLLRRVGESRLGRKVPAAPATVLRPTNLSKAARTEGTLAIVLIATVMSASAGAETFRIQTGVFGFDTGDPSAFVFEGDRFRVSGVFVPATDAPANECFGSCLPGTIVDLSSVFGGAGAGFSLGTGTGATIDGIDYLGGNVAQLFGTFVFDSQTVALPPILAPELRLTAPFTFAGQMAGFRGSTALFELDLEGQGTASLVLGTSEGRYQFRSFSYDFESAEPIPEPATLLLCGTGLASLLVRRRSKRRQEHS